MKKLKMLTIVLVVILITMIAFGGIYIQKQNRMENIIKNYSYAMDLKGARNIRLKVNQENKTVIKDSEGKEVESSEDLTDDKIKEKGYTKEEIPYNSQESQKEENYKESKRIIEERLKSLKITDYNIKMDESTGDILLEIAENDNTDSIVSNIGTVGKFEIIDSETKEVLMDNNDIKLANVMYGSSNSSTTSSSSGTTVYLNIEFTKEGAKKLEDISSKYVKTSTSDNTTDNTDSSDTTTSSTEKKITMKIDDEEIMSTSFDETLKTGKIQLSIGKATTDSKTLQGYVSQASNIAVVLDSGKMPIKYDVDENQYVLSDITNQELDIVVNILIGIVAILSIIFIIRYKLYGAIGAVSYIGLISIFLILIRYANVNVSIQGILAIALVCILNYVFINKLICRINKKDSNKETTNQKIKEVYKEFFVKIIPICIATIVFCFAGWDPISSFGMIMFWGIVLIAIYNYIITSTLVKIQDNK